MDEPFVLLLSMAAALKKMITSSTWCHGSGDCLLHTISQYCKLSCCLSDTGRYPWMLREVTTGMVPHSDDISQIMPCGCSFVAIENLFLRGAVAIVFVCQFSYVKHAT